MENQVKSNTEKQYELSLCEVFKDDTSEVMRKLESQTPSLFQNYSNLYTAYLHMFDNLFGTCFISEKKFFDKLNLDQSFLKQIKFNSEAIKKVCLENIDKNTQFIDQYTEMRTSSIQSFDRYVHVLMESYANYLSQFNQSKKQ
ncbi:MAG: hypothetical protein OEL52_04290 [Nitrosopumilus sp.]|nr:hypothetical protein [Nitrosopumilus sp.]